MSRLRTAFAILAIMGFALAGASSAWAAGGEGADPGASTPASTLEIAYKIYVGGVALGKTDMRARFQNGEYRVNSRLETGGIVNMFWKAKIEASSSGRMDGTTFYPLVYDSYTDDHKDKNQQVSLTFNPQGPIGLFADPAYNTSKYPVSDEEKKATADPMSAAIYLIAGVSADASAPCGRVARVFDGRRRYDVAFAHEGERNVDMDNGVYSGRALVCKIDYRQVAGFKPKIIKEGESFPDVFAWVAEMKSRADPKLRYLVPLRIWAQSPYGVVVALLDKVQLDGTSLARTE